MLKFIFVAFLFLGLIVQGQFDQENTEVAKDAVEFNEKAAKEDVVQESEENVESEQEESEEEEESDYAGAVEKVVSEDNSEEFDQNDDVGSKALLEENEEQDDNSAWCHLSRCVAFKRMRHYFHVWRNRCIACLRSRRCRGVCHAYARWRRYGHRRCRARVIRAYRVWNARLRNNYKQLAHAIWRIKRYAYAMRYWNNRAGRKSMRYLIARRNWHARMYHLSRRRMIYGHNKMVHAHRVYLHFRRLKIYAARRRNWRLYHRYRHLKYAWRRAFWRWYRYKKHQLAHMRHYLAWYHKYNRMIVYKKRYYAFRRALIAWIRRRNWLIRRRRWLLAMRRRAGYNARKRCAHIFRVLRNRCIFCHGRCGGNCWHMHRFYALMVLTAHRCKLQRFLCGRRAIYLRKFHAWNRAFWHCWRHTHPRLRHLKCSGRYGARYKYLLLFHYYHKKCVR